MVPTGERGQFRWFYAWAWETQGAGDIPDSFASVGAGTCERKKTRRMVMTICTGNRWAHARRYTFTMAPDASSAEMSFKADGFTHRASWTARDPDPGFYSAEEYCEDSQGNEGVGIGGGIWRPARATGRVFGRKLTKATHWTELTVGAMASQCSWVDRSFTRDGRALLTVRIPR